LGIRGDQNFDLSKKEFVWLDSKRVFQQSRKHPLYKKKETIWVNSQKGRDGSFWRRSGFERE